MSKQASNSSTFETAVEFLLFPALLVLPYILFKDTYTQISAEDEWNSFYIAALAVLAALAVSVPQIVVGMKGPRRAFFAASGITLGAAGALLPFVNAPRGGSLWPTLAVCAAACAALAVARAKSRGGASGLDLAVSILTVAAGLALPYSLAAFGLEQSKAVVFLLFVPLALPLYLFATTPDSRDPDRPLARVILIFIVHSLAMSLYFVLFRSYESFRLPQLTAMQATVALNVALAFASSALKGRLELRKSPLNVPILLITVVTLLSFALSPNFFVSLKEFLQYAFVVMNFLLIVHCLDGRRHYGILVSVFIAALWIEALAGVQQHFGANRLLGLGGNRDPFSTLGNKNYAAELLAMGIPFVVAVSMGVRERWKKALCWIALYPMLTVVVLAITRGSWIGVIASVAALGLFAVDGLGGRKAVEAAAHIAALALLTVFIAAVSTRNLVLTSVPESGGGNAFISEALEGCSGGASVSLGGRRLAVCSVPSSRKSSFFENNYVSDWVSVSRRLGWPRLPVDVSEPLTPQETVARLRYAAASVELEGTEAAARLGAYLDSLETAPPVFYARVGYGPPDYSYVSRFMSIVDIASRRLGRSPVMWAAFFVGFAAMMAAGWFAMRTRRGKTAAVSALAVLMVAFSAASVARRAETPPAQAAPAQTTFSAPAAPQVVDDSIVSRSFIWGGAREMIKHHPFGVGIGAFKVRYLSMLTVHLEKSGISTIPGFFKDVNAKEAHCEYLHIWAELGFIGLALLLYFFFAVFKYFKKIYYPLKDDPFTQCVALGAFSALASVAASAVFGFPFHIIGTSMFCGAALALLVFSEDRLLGAGTLPKNLPGFGARKDRDDGESKKGKKNKRKKEAAAELAPDMSWKDRWAVVGLSRPASIAGMAAASLFFILILKFSVDVQMANILMKKGNSYARRATELAAGADAAERRGNSAEAVAYRNGAADFDKQALDLLEQSLKLDPYNGDIHLFRGMFFQKHDQNDEAMASYIEARRHYDLPQISLDLGALYFEKGEEYYDQAAKNFIDSMRVYPNYPLPRYNLGLIFYQKAMSLVSPEKQGMTDAQAAEETAGMLRELDNLRRRERGGGAGAAIPRPSTRVEIARLLFRESALMFRESININPSLDTAAFKLGITFERLFEIEEDDPVKKLDHIDNALYWYKYTVGVNPSHADALYNYALALTRKAAVISSRADAAPDPAQARSLREDAAKASAESRAVFEKVLNVNPSHTLTLNNLGNMYFNDGRIEESIEMYKRALAADPDYLNARLNIALAYMQTGRYAQTIEYLEEAMRRPLEPAHELKVVYLVGSSYFKMGRNAEAMAVLDHVRMKYARTPFASNHEYFSIVTRYGEALVQAGRSGEARKALEALVAGGTRFVPAPTAAEAYYLLGVAAAKSGDPAAARSYLNTVLTTYSATPVRANAANFLKTVK